MKKKSFEKKLVLKKQTIATLNEKVMDNAKGGFQSLHYQDCVSALKTLCETQCGVFKTCAHCPNIPVLKF